jgi:hypothetical protein
MVDNDRAEALFGSPLEFAALQMKLLAAMSPSARQFFYRRWAANVDLICSILPSDFEGMRLGGAGVQRHYGFAPLPVGHGLSVLMLCAPRHVRIGTVSDPAIIGEPSKLGRCLVDAYAALVAGVAA